MTRPHLTHDELTTIGIRWLKRGSNRARRDRSGPSCSFVASEVKAAYSGEIVDALGFRTAEGMETILVESKVSRSDFLADAKKPHRTGATPGVGNYRYYLCPEGLIQPQEIPDGWGLLWVGQRNTVTALAGHILAAREARASFWFHSDRDAELALMTWLLAKIGDADKLIRDRKRLVRDYNRIANTADRYAADLRRLSVANSKLRQQLTRAGLEVN